MPIRASRLNSSVLRNWVNVVQAARHSTARMPGMAPP
jgi:hypothetical protein